MLLYYIKGQRGVDLDGKCKKKNMTRGLQSLPPPTHTHRPTTILLDLFKK